MDGAEPGKWPERGWVIGFLPEGEEATGRLPRGSDRGRPQSGRALRLGVARPGQGRKDVGTGPGSGEGPRAGRAAQAWRGMLGRAGALPASGVWGPRAAAGDPRSHQAAAVGTGWPWAWAGTCGLTRRVRRPGALSQLTGGAECDIVQTKKRRRFGNGSPLRSTYVF